MTIDEVKKAIEGKEGLDLKNAAMLEERLSLHTTFDTTRPAGLHRFLNFVGNILPKDKWRLFKQLMSYPTETTPLVEEIHKSLKKIFNGRDPKNDLPEIPEELFDQNAWREEAWAWHIGNPSAILVIDKEIKEDSEENIPYYYFLPIKAVDQLALNKNNTIKFIRFKNKKKQTVFICNEYYRILNDEGSAITENPHNIGYCPASFLLHEIPNQKDKAFRANSISKLIGALDWLLFQEISSKYAELYMKYPIYWGYESECDFEQGDTYCDKGYLRHAEGYLYEQGTELVKCPKCGDRLAGVGSFVEVPTTAENVATPPVGLVSADIPAYTTGQESLKKYKQSLFATATGNYMESINDKAVNEKQVMSLYESRLNALEQLKASFEKTEAWTIKTLLLFYTGAEEKVNINYGTRFYLSTISEAVENYSTAKEKELQFSLLDELQDEIFALKYKSDPKKKERYRILRDLDPLRHVTFDQGFKMYEQGLINKETLFLHINLSTLLSEVEKNMNGNIGPNLTEEERFKMIKEGVENLAAEKIATTNINNNDN